MELNTQEILNAQFYTLPLAVQDIINENEWKMLIRNLAADYRLHQDQADIIESVTLLTILGFASTQHFNQNLVAEAKIDSGIANEIGKRVNSEVFDVLEQVALLVEAEQAEDLGDDSLLILDDARSKQVDLQKLDLSNENDLSAKKLLDEIENPENYISDLPVGRAETKLQDHVDEISSNKPEVLDDSPNNKKPATHMRTLKSDIVKAKLENPSWKPQITKAVDEDIAIITQDALKETQERQANKVSQQDLYHEEV